MTLILIEFHRRLLFYCLSLSQLYRNINKIFNNLLRIKFIFSIESISSSTSIIIYTFISIPIQNFIHLIFIFEYYFFPIISWDVFSICKRTFCCKPIGVYVDLLNIFCGIEFDLYAFFIFILEIMSVHDTLNFCDSPNVIFISHI